MTNRVLELEVVKMITRALKEDISLDNIELLKRHLPYSDIFLFVKDNAGVVSLLCDKVAQDKFGTPFKDVSEFSLRFNLIAKIILENYYPVFRRINEEVLDKHTQLMNMISTSYRTARNAGLDEEHAKVYSELMNRDNISDGIKRASVKMLTENKDESIRAIKDITRYFESRGEEDLVRKSVTQFVLGC